MDVCRALRRENVRDRFIFVSAYPHYALDCLNVHAYDLLLKPVDLNALKQCLISVYRDIQADAPQMLDIQIGSRLIRMPVRDVYYFESQGRNVIAHTLRRTVSFRFTANIWSIARTFRNGIPARTRYWFTERRCRSRGECGAS